MKKILALLLAAGSYTAFADPTNLYVGAAAGAGWNNTAFPATAFRVDGGYNFTEGLAVEIGTTGITQSGTGDNQSMQYYDLSVKGTLPLGDTFDLFGQFGGAYGSPGLPATNANGNGVNYNNNPGIYQAGWNFFTAAGVQLNLTRQFALNLGDYYYYGAPNPQGNTDAVLLGAKYNF